MYKHKQTINASNVFIIPQYKIVANLHRVQIRLPVAAWRPRQHVLQQNSPATALKLERGFPSTRLVNCHIKVERTKWLVNRIQLSAEFIDQLPDA